MTDPAWESAITYPEAPHEYVLLPDHPVTFKHYSDLIREAGVEEQFTLRGRTATYRYYYENGFKYWIIGDVLNRCRSDGAVKGGK